MRFEETLRLHENAAAHVPDSTRVARAVRLGILHDHLRAGRIQAGEHALLTLIGVHANDAELALMLPNIFVTVLPDILSGGSSFFFHADGLPFRYGTKYSPAEYSCLYAERVLRDPLPLGDARTAPLAEKTPAHDILTCMWALLYDMLTPDEKRSARARLQDDALLSDFLPADNSNVVLFRSGPKTATPADPAHRD